MPTTDEKDTTTNPANSPGFYLPNIAERLFATPLLMTPDKAQAIAWALRDRMGLTGLAEPTDDAMKAAGPGLFGETMDRRAGYHVVDGVAVLPIQGTLVNRGAWIGASSGLTSYEGLNRQIDLIAGDDRIRAVMLDVDSRGGEASGTDDLAASIRALDQIKPVYAMIDGVGASAAYWLASAARRVYIARTSVGGSIGVVLTHYDASEAAKQQGFTITHIHAGADKVLGSPWQSLTDEDRAKLQAKVDSLYRVFVETVAEYRGLSTEDVRATEAGVFDGPGLVEQGLADGVTTGRQLLAAIQTNFDSPDPQGISGFSSGATRANGNNGGNSMPDPKENGGAEQSATTYTQAEVDSLISEQRAENEDAVANARAEGAKTERDRIGAILGADAAAGRSKLAHHLAFKTEQSVEDAVAALEASGVETAAPGMSPLAAAMAGQDNRVNSDDGTDGGQDEVATLAESIINA